MSILRNNNNYMRLHACGTGDDDHRPVFSPPSQQPAPSSGNAADKIGKLQAAIRRDMAARECKSRAAFPATEEATFRRTGLAVGRSWESRGDATRARLKSGELAPEPFGDLQEDKFE